MKLIKSNQGSVLVITLGFILIFTMIGLAAIHMAGANNEWATKQIFSDEAFWLADGRVDRSRSELPNSTLQLNIDSGNQLTTEVDPPFSWIVRSEADVEGQKRKIEAVIDASGIATFGDINANGNIDNFVNGQECNSIGGSSTVNCERVEEFMNFDFDDMFPNVPEITPTSSVVDQSFRDANPSNSPEHYSNLPNSSGLIYIKINEQNSNNVNLPALSNTTSNPGFIIIDFTDKPANNSGNLPNLSLQIADFHGIIWVKGNANVSATGIGTGQYVGSFFMDGSGEVSFGGSTRLNFEQNGDPVPQSEIDAALEGALAQLQGNTIPNCPPDCPSDPIIVSWKEVAPTLP